jgi:glycine/D-amino acid oxidase-like deaminating enzyme/nitrite reductase/ring-hydroxylating ferredoxin subunit
MIFVQEGSVNKHGMPGKAVSYWIDSTPATRYPPLTTGVEVDVAVLGGGIAGITTAALLKQRGAKVALVEAGRIANLVSGRTTAQISAASTPSYYRDIAHSFGEKDAQACIHSVVESIEKIAEIVGTHDIACDFKHTTDYLYGAEKGHKDSLREEAEFEQRFGLQVSFEDSAPLPFENYGAVKYRGHAEFHPRKYLLGLAGAIPGDGCHIFEETRAYAIKEGGPCTISTDHGDLKARDVVVATGVPITNLGFLYARMVVRRSYVLGIHIKDELPDALFYSSEAPCHYIRTVPSSPGLVLVGGEDHITGAITDTKNQYTMLEKFCRDHFKLESVDYSWSAQCNYPFDGLPFIGRLPGSRHQYVATGFKGTGMTYGTLAGMIISDLIRDGKSPYEALYSPGRVNVMASGQEFLQRNMYVAHMFAEARLEKPEPASKVSPGKAALVDVNGEKAAAYRDNSGRLHAVSPVCTHMGCYVKWNDAEQTWDCPCHGSRYTEDGDNLNAPAAFRLTPREGDEKKKD